MQVTSKEHKAKQKRKERHTPGSYAFREIHGLGLAGLRGYLRKRTWYLKKCREIVRNKLLTVNEEIIQLEEEINGNR